MPENEEAPANDAEFDAETFTEPAANSIDGADSLAAGGCCGRHGSEPGVLWNDAGHRTQIERAIWILAAAEPAGEILSLWSMKFFRDAVYEGIWAADYKDPYNNFGKIPFYEGPFWTSHFWNPATGTNYGQENLVMRLVSGAIKEFDKNALTAALYNLDLAVQMHDWWTGGTRTQVVLMRMGYHLGIALHYVTDLTQPMHAANFTNVWGFQGSVSFNKDDKRHSAFEGLADKLLDPSRSERATLLQDAAVARMVFQDGLQALIESTAKDANGVFLTMKPVLENMKPNEAFPEAAGLRALQAALPRGQRNTALVLQQWVRQSRGQGRGLRSDWMAVSERKDASGTRRPCMFYRRDADLHPVFRFLEGSEWREDPNPAFAEFAGTGINAATAFAAAYDEGATDHPALFVANSEGQLFYVNAAGSPRQWTKSGPLLGAGVQRVAGSIVSTYDERYGTPSAFFRSWDGVLHYVCWDKQRSAFAVYPFADQPRVGGAICAVWDPADSGLGDGKGHIAVCYVRGDGALQYLHVRQGAWKSLVFEIDAEAKKAGAHADPRMLAAVYSQQFMHVAVFWGLVRYVKKQVPQDPELYFWEQQPGELRRTEVSIAGLNTLVLRDGSSAAEPEHAGSATGDAFATGGIGAASKPRLAVHFAAPNREGFQMRVIYEQDARGIFRRTEFPEEQVAGPIVVVDAGAANANWSIVGYRQRDRQCYTGRNPEAAAHGE